MTNYKRTKLSTVRKLSKPTFINTRDLNSPCYSHYKKKKEFCKRPELQKTILYMQLLKIIKSYQRNKQKTFWNSLHRDHHAFHEQNIITKRQYPIRGKTRKNQGGSSMQLCIHYSSPDRLSSCLNALQSYNCASIVSRIIRLRKNLNEI